MNLDNVIVGDIETTGFIEDMKGVESELHVLGIS